MKRLIPKIEVEKAKKELRDDFISRIVKDFNDKGCWHLKSINKSIFIDSIVHFSERGTKKIFFKAKRLSFEYFKGDLAENFVVYSKCDNKYCINPDHHYSSTFKSYINKQIKSGLRNVRSGFRHRPETIAKMSQSQKGQKPDKKARLKMRLAKLGVNNRSPETIERCAELYYRGEKNATAKLTNAQVLEIRRLEKFCSARELSERYPVTIRHIRAIWKRKVWKHI